MTVEEMERELISLDKESRSEILYFLINLVEDDEADCVDISEEEYDRLWAEECRRRIESFERGEMKAIPAEEVFAEADKIIETYANKRAGRLAV
jgi:L-rhamnose mutarotase